MTVTASGLPATIRAFDRLSVRYDRLCEGDILSRLRRHTHARMAALFGRGSRVLEIGCGTGLDTAFLATLGVTVTAADPSAGMLASARARMRASGLSVHLLCCGLDELETHVDLETSGPLDGIVSNFGALNCAARLDTLARLAHRSLRPGGWIVLGLMTPSCAWEQAWFLLHGHPREAFRRRRRPPVLVEVDGIAVPTYYHRIADVMAMLGVGFRLGRLTGLGVALPPPYLEWFWTRLPRPVRRTVAAIDEAVSPRFPFNRLGDHTLLEIQWLPGSAA
ncbi:MAG TPA: class I SAM-dependent methyltransferase [Vicinamibacterales bacterium]|nr:class I SAM-dependent methyltransferase [Vicinamibacterales bacterium]